MHFLTSRIRSVFPHWNERSITEDECWEFVVKNRILVKRYPFAAKGYFGRYTFRNKPKYYIVIDEGLRGPEFLRVFLHEIGHAILHEPFGCREVLYFRKDNAIESKQDFEADVFAAVALIPRQQLLSGEHDGQLRDLIERRVSLASRHGI